MAKKEEVKINIRPLDDRVVVETLDAEEQTPGGILLPDTAKQKPQRGRVIAVGPGKLRDNGERNPVAVAVGDEVLFGRYAGNDVEVNGKEIKIMRENEILAKVTK
jgi:chaperonin GroES